MRPIFLVFAGLFGLSCALQSCNRDLIKEVDKVLVDNANAVSGASSSPDTTSSTMALKNLAKTTNSRIKIARNEVIRDKERFASLWKEHTGSESQLPTVDFSKEMVLAAFMGQKNTGGYSITIDKATLAGQHLTVSLVEKKPTPDMFVTQVLTAPAHMVSLPKNSAEVHFSGSASAPAPRSTPSASERNPISMRTVSKTSNSQIREARQNVIKDLATFKTLWQEHTGSDDNLPTVNFDDEMVLALFMGERPTGGYSLTIQELLTEGSGLRVVFKESKPSPDSMTIQVLTAPALLVAVPKSSGAVRFEKAAE